MVAATLGAFWLGTSAWAQEHGRPDFAGAQIEEIKATVRSANEQSVAIQTQAGLALRVKSIYNETKALRERCDASPSCRSLPSGLFSKSAYGVLGWLTASPARLCPGTGRAKGCEDLTGGPLTEAVRRASEVGRQAQVADSLIAAQTELRRLEIELATAQVKDGDERQFQKEMVRRLARIEISIDQELASLSMAP